MLLYRKLVSLLIALIWVTPAYATALSIPFSFTPSTPITAGPFNSNFASVSSWANGNVDNSNLATGANIDLIKLNLTQQLPILRAASSLCFSAGTTGDTVPRIGIDSNGGIQLGAGGSTAADVLIRRSGVGVTAFRDPANANDTSITAKNLTMSGNLVVGGTITGASGVAVKSSFGGDGSDGPITAFPGNLYYNATTVAIGTTPYTSPCGSVVNSTQTQVYATGAAVTVGIGYPGGFGSGASDPASCGGGPVAGQPGVGTVGTTGGGGGSGAGGGGFGASLGTALLRARGGGANQFNFVAFTPGSGGAGSGAQSTVVGSSGGAGGGTLRICSVGAVSIGNSANCIAAPGSPGNAAVPASCGGAGGGGAGAIYIGSLSSISTGTSTTSISAIGGVGGNGGATTGGGGGGGAGGLIILQSPVIVSNLIQAAACAGGAPGTGASANGGAGTNGFLFLSPNTPNAPLVSGLIDHHGFDKLYCLGLWKRIVDKQDTSKSINLTQHEMALACSDTLDQYARCMTDVLDTQCNLGVGEVPDAAPDCG